MSKNPPIRAIVMRIGHKHNPIQKEGVHIYTYEGYEFFLSNDLQVYARFGPSGHYYHVSTLENMIRLLNEPSRYTHATWVFSIEHLEQIMREVNHV